MFLASFLRSGNRAQRGFVDSGVLSPGQKVGITNGIYNRVFTAWTSLHIRSLYEPLVANPTQLPDYLVSIIVLSDPSPKDSSGSHAAIR